MIEELTHSELVKAYRELQLRVTRFSATEQELINARDLLDQELESYKRLQHYSGLSLETKDEVALLQLMTEAIIDILDIESAVIFFKCLEDESRSKIFTEGVASYHSTQLFCEEIQSFTEIAMLEKTHHLQASDFSDSTFFSLFSSAVFNRFKEIELNYQLYIVAAITLNNEKLYSPFQQRKIHLFNLLCNQMHSVLAKIMSSRKIEEQFETISKSANELRKLSLIATKTKSGVIITDTYGKVEWVNEAFTKISGYTLQDTLGRKPKEFLQGPDTTEENKTKLSEALARKEDIEMVVINYTKDGKPYFNQLEIVSVFDEEGQHINFIAIQKDITTEINYQQEMLKMNSRFKMISASTRIGIWELDVESGHFSANDIMADILGLEQFNGNYDHLFELWKKAINPEDLSSFDVNFQLLLSGSHNSLTQQYRLKRLDKDEVVYVKSVTVVQRDNDGKVIRLIGGIQDISAEMMMQLKLEKALQERDTTLGHINVIKNFYENILKYSPSEIMVFDKQLKLQFSNSNSRSSNSPWNIPIDSSYKDLSLSDLQSNVADILYNIQEAICENKLIQVEDFFKNNQHDVYYLRSIMPTHNRNGDIENVIVTGVDITELKNIQQDVLKKNEELSKINMELDHFVYSISHDLRSPLLSIKGLISLVMQTEEITEKNQKFLQLTLNSATRLDNTIQEILEYSRNSRLDLAVVDFDLVEVVGHVIDDLRYVDDVPSVFNITTNTQDGKVMLRSDKMRLGVVLKNIIGNSIKYRRQDVVSRVDVNIALDVKTCFVEISDNGEGIAPRHLEKVFDMFYRGTTTSVGTGLGLYICREIVTKIGGKINISSQLGSGTQVFIEIPNLK